MPKRELNWGTILATCYYELPITYRSESVGIVPSKDNFTVLIGDSKLSSQIHQATHDTLILADMHVLYLLLVTGLARINGKEHGPFVLVVTNSAPVSASQLAQHGVSVIIDPFVEQLLQRTC